MGAQPTKVQSSLNVLRGTPVEVWSRSEGRWIEAVIGAPKDVREPPPESSAVLVLFKEVVGGRCDAFKWVKSDDIPELIRARPEAKRQAGMMDSMASMNFNTMFENRSTFEQRGAPGGIHVDPQNPQKPCMSSIGAMSIPAERPQEQQAGVMSSIMASVGLAPSMASMAPSMASTIDHNSSRIDFGRRPGMSSIAEDSPNFMASLMGTQTYPQQQEDNTNFMSAQTCPQTQEESPNFMASFMGTQTYPQQQYDPNVHRPLSVDGIRQHEQQHQQTGVMGNMSGMLPASLMSTMNASLPIYSSMVEPRSHYGENSSPNRTPMASLNDKGQPFAPNPMSSFMASMGFAAEPESSPGQMQTTVASF